MIDFDGIFVIARNLQIRDFTVKPLRVSDIENFESKFNNLWSICSDCSFTIYVEINLVYNNYFYTSTSSNINTYIENVIVMAKSWTIS